jgi:hypothetical protein
MIGMLLAATLSLTDAKSAELVQQSPRPGAPSPYRTTISALTDGNTIRVRFDCADPDPSRIAVHTMQHDDTMKGDDTVSVVIDTFGDHRTGYFFSVNAAGARAEGLISDRSGATLDWDGVWDASVSRRANGWTAEISIPVSTLRFVDGVSTFGFNAERRVPRDGTVLRFASPTLDSSLFDLVRAGELIGIESLHSGSGATVAASALTRAQRTFDAPASSSTQGSGALDAGYRITPQLNGSVTVHTDFAETEVDTRQINLTRFPLFFPEKRRFFAEGSNQFQFGYGLGTSFIPFYSRRIGLVNGDVVPIDAGAKLLGRGGKWSIAALDVRSESNLFAARGTYDVDSHLRVGGIVTRGDPLGNDNRYLAGGDATWNTSKFLGDKNLLASAWGARTDHGGDGYGATIVLPNDLWNAQFSYADFGESLHPALGFLPRPGTRREVAGTDFRPRTEAGQYGFQLYGTRIADKEGTQSSEIFATPYGFEWHDGFRFELNDSSRYERLDAPFEIADGVTIPRGGYHFNVSDIQLQSPPGKPIVASAILAYGTFYDGHIRQVIVTAGWSHPSARLQLTLDSETDFGNLANGRFIQRLHQLKTIYALSPNWILSSYIQYDSESHSIGMNNRLRWTLRPTVDLFLVWNRGWREAPFAPVGEQLVAKLRWIVQR